jgi:hypothetical protein
VANRGKLRIFWNDFLGRTFLQKRPPQTPPQKLSNYGMSYRVNYSKCQRQCSIAKDASWKLVGAGLRAGTFYAYKSTSSARQGRRALTMFLECGPCKRSQILATAIKTKCCLRDVWQQGDLLIKAVPQYRRKGANDSRIVDPHGIVQSGGHNLRVFGEGFSGKLSTEIFQISLQISFHQGLRPRLSPFHGHA